MQRVASCILQNKDGEILILKRSEKVRTYKGLWGVVAGYIEEDETPLKTAIKEIREEVGLDQNYFKLKKSLDPIEFTDFYEGKKYDWQIYPFLFIIEKKGKINIDWEHLEYCWIKPPDIEKYKTVPHLKEIVLKISKSFLDGEAVEVVRRDRKK